MRPLLLGMADPHSDDPRHALYPDPPGCAGHRLYAMTGMTIREYLTSFKRANLCGRDWDAVVAQERAGKLLSERIATPVVVLGCAVWNALGLGPRPGNGESVRVSRRHFYYLPHPSGQNLAYNDPATRAIARQLLRRLARK